MPGDPELDELLARFGAGERTWELGARLAAVLAAAGRTAQVPGILVKCRPLELETLGSEKVVEVMSGDRVALAGWRLPRKLGGSGILVYGADEACEVRMGDAFVLEPGAGWALQRSTGETVAASAGGDMQSALEKFAAAIGASVARSVE